MSEAHQPPPTQAIYPPWPPASARSRRWPWTVAILAAFVFGVGVGSVGDSATPTAPTAAGATEITQAADDPTEEAEPTEEAAPQYDEPTVDDFQLDIKTLEKACFGSAGCNVTYRVELAYDGVLGLDPTKTFEITYEVIGGEDPMINTLEATGDSY